jgi:hypothetical protein
MSEIEFKNYVEHIPSITKLDIVKTEHDLISDYIDRANRCIEDGVTARTEDMVRYIDGIRTMAEALMDILNGDTALDNLLNRGIGEPPDDNY